MSTLTVDLAAECGPLPGGAVVAGNYQGNLVITVEGVLSWSGPMKWGLRVTKPTETASGRKGKPKSVLLLVANEGETPADLLRSLAKMWDIGAVTTGVTYDDPDEGQAEGGAE